jgi:electron transfer flavoprotein alpha subunit
VVLDGEPQLADQLAEYGADKVIRVDGMAWDGADIGIPARIVARLAEERLPQLILVAGTVFGRDLAPRIAVRLTVGLVEDCTFLRLGADGVVEGTRLEEDGDSATRVAWDPHRPALATVPPGTFRSESRLEWTAPETSEIACPEVGESRTTLVDSRRIDPGELPLEDVPVIVAGGLGMGGPEGFDLLSDLAAAMGGKVAASRRATDLGWAERDALVGQTGKTVEPALYLACGISGASQHILGMKDSGYVVSINTDPYAPMRGIADLAVTADALELVPLLTEEFERVSHEAELP